MQRDIEVTDEYFDYMCFWSREYLKRVRSCVHTIAMIRSEIACLEDQLDGLRGIDYSNVRGTGVATDDAMVERIARIDELKAEFKDELDRNLQAQADAHRALSNVRQPWRAVLTYRYLECMKWSEVADLTGYSVHHCKHDLHENGLVELFPYVPHEFDEFPEAI